MIKKECRGSELERECVYVCRETESEGGRQVNCRQAVRTTSFLLTKKTGGCCISLQRAALLVVSASKWLSLFSSSSSSSLVFFTFFFRGFSRVLHADA